MKNEINKLTVRKYDDCGPKHVEPCDPVKVDSCSTCKEIDLGNVNPTHPGLLIDVSATVRNLCPNKQISVACILCEKIGHKDVVRAVQVRQFRTPKKGHCVCLDVDFRFAFPQKCGCNDRIFKAKIISNYINPTGCKCPCKSHDCKPCSCHCRPKEDNSCSYKKDDDYSYSYKKDDDYSCSYKKDDDYSCSYKKDDDYSCSYDDYSYSYDDDHSCSYRAKDDDASCYTMAEDPRYY